MSLLPKLNLLTAKILQNLLQRKIFHSKMATGNISEIIANVRLRG